MSEENRLTALQMERAAILNDARIKALHEVYTQCLASGLDDEETERLMQAAIERLAGDPA